MKASSVMLLLLAAFLCGCASTIEDRRKERLAAYSQLPAETQSLIDEGQIKVGMPKDAVYIAWGKPDQVITSESDQGRSEIWLYHGSVLRPYHYWSYGPGFYGWGPWHGGYGGYYHYNYGLPYLETDWYPQYYVSSEVQFENDHVKHWRSLPHPPY
jgi:hypothetical protein